MILNLTPSRDTSTFAPPTVTPTSVSESTRDRLLALSSGGVAGGRPKLSRWASTLVWIGGAESASLGIGVPSSSSGCLVTDNASRRCGRELQLEVTRQSPSQCAFAGVCARAVFLSRFDVEWEVRLWSSGGELKSGGVEEFRAVERLTAGHMKEAHGKLSHQGDDGTGPFSPHRAQPSCRTTLWRFDPS